MHADIYLCEQRIYTDDDYLSVEERKRDGLTSMCVCAWRVWREWNPTKNKVYCRSRSVYKYTSFRCFWFIFWSLVNDKLMGNNQFTAATLDEATITLIKRKTRMKTSEITNWYNEIKVRLDILFFRTQNLTWQKPSFACRWTEIKSVETSYRCRSNPQRDTVCLFSLASVGPLATYPAKWFPFLGRQLEKIFIRLLMRKIKKNSPVENNYASVIFINRGIH